ncbi:transposable element Tc1 transposase [Trichonephila clavipes]|nr:transposable element Tc1 transposase [Trichonephila clavipes]
MAQTDRTASSRQLAAQWSTATDVSLCASSIRRCLLQRGLRARIPLYRIPLTQWANVHRSWRANWQQVVFSDESRFNLRHHDGRIRVRRYAGERHIEQHINVHYRTPQGTNTRSYGLGCHSISWTITIAANCGQFEQYPIHKRSFTAPSYSFPARIAKGCIPAG